MRKFQPRPKKQFFIWINRSFQSSNFCSVINSDKNGLIPCNHVPCFLMQKKKLSFFKKIGSRLQPSKLLKCCLSFMWKEDVLLHLKSNICDFQWKLLLYPSKSSARKSTIMVTIFFYFLIFYQFFFHHKWNGAWLLEIKMACTNVLTSCQTRLQVSRKCWDFMELEPGAQFSCQNENFVNANKKSLEVLSQILCLCLSMKKFFSF